MKSLHQFLTALFLILLPLSASIGIDMYLPAFQQIATSFHIHPGEVNDSMAIYLLGLAIGQFIYGLFSDYYGRKKFLLVGLGIFVAGSLLCAVAHHYWLLLLARLIQATGACSTLVLSRAVITDLYAPTMRSRMLALISAVNILSPAFAPLLGSVAMLAFHWRGIFIILAGFGILLFLAIAFTLENRPPTLTDEKLTWSDVKMHLGSLFKSRLFTGYLIGISLLYAATFVWVTNSPSILMSHFHVATKNFGDYFLVPALGTTIGALTTVALSQKFGELNFSRLGYSIVVVASFILYALQYTSFYHVPESILLPMMLLFIGIGMVQALQISAALAVHPEIAGLGAAIIGFSQGASAGLVGVITSYVPTQNLRLLIMMMITTVVLAVAGFLTATVKFNLFKRRQLPAKP